jgi:hypothetical protein
MRQSGSAVSGILSAGCSFLLRALSVGVLIVLLAGCLAANKGAPARVTHIDLGLTNEQLDYYDRADPDLRKSYRNELVAARMYAIDMSYTEFEGALMRERQNIGFLTTTATLGLTGAVPLVDSTSTKDILGAAGAFITGTRAAYNDEILLKSTVQMIVNQMRANRDKEKTKILLKRNQPADQYPLGDALGDVEAYYRAGTLVSGIVEATETVGENAARVESDKEQVEVVELARDSSRTRLDRFLNPDGHYDEARAEQLRSLLKARGVNPNELWKVWKLASYARQREQLISDALGAGLPI